MGPASFTLHGGAVPLANTDLSAEPMWRRRASSGPWHGGLAMQFSRFGFSGIAMRIWVTSLMVGAALALASCSTGPQQRTVVPAQTAEPGTSLPYQWTQGNAPQAYKDSVAAFGRLALKPGQYRW